MLKCFMSRIPQFGEPRRVQENQLIHSSVFALMEKKPQPYVCKARIHNGTNLPMDNKDLEPLKLKAEEDPYAKANDRFQQLEYKLMEGSKIDNADINVLLVNVSSSRESLLPYMHGSLIKIMCTASGRHSTIEVPDAVNIWMLLLRAESDRLLLSPDSESPGYLPSLIKIAKAFKSSPIASQLCIITALRSIKLKLVLSRDSRIFGSTAAILGECLSELERQLTLGDSRIPIDELQKIAAVHKEKLSKIRDNLQRVGHLGDLPTIFLTQFEYSRDNRSLECAFEEYKSAVRLAKDYGGNAQTHLLTTTFKTALRRLFISLKHAGYLYSAMTCACHALEMFPDDAAIGQKPTWLENLFSTLKQVIRLKELECLIGVNKAVELAKKATALLLNNHDNKLRFLLDLSTIFRLRSFHYHRHTAQEKLDEAMSYATQTHELITKDPNSTDADKSACFAILSAIHRGTIYMGEVSVDVEKSIELARHTVDLIPEDHPDMAARLVNLALSLETRFYKNGRGKGGLGSEDLDEAIRHSQKAISLNRDDDPSKPSNILYLDRLLQTRRFFLPKAADLEQVIALPKDLEVLRNMLFEQADTDDVLKL
jgi:tetratricopeptide (TPR) repeat protein